MILFFFAACTAHVTPLPASLAEYVGDPLHARGAAFGPGIAAWPEPSGDDPTRTEIVAIVGDDVRRLPFDNLLPELGGGAGIAWVGRRHPDDPAETLCLMTRSELFCAESPFPGVPGSLEVRLLDGSPAVWHNRRRAARPAGKDWALIDALDESHGIALDEAWRNDDTLWRRQGGMWERVDEPAAPIGQPATAGSDGRFVAWVTRGALPHPGQRGNPVSVSRTTAEGVLTVQTDVGVPTGVLPVSNTALLIRGSEAIELWRSSARVERLPSSAGTTLGVDSDIAWVGVGTTPLRFTNSGVDAFHLERGRFEWPGPLGDARIETCGTHPALVWEDAEGRWVATQGAQAVQVGRACPDAPRPWPEGKCEGAHVLEGSGGRACVRETRGATLVALRAG